jgi:hypothetical protein
MILIDRSKNNQIIVLTLRDSTQVTNPVYFLTLVSDGTGDDLKIVLPTSTSNYPERFDLFNVATAVFVSLNDGIYSYSVKDQNDLVVETGKALIKSPVVSEVISPDSSSNEFLIYGE